MNTTDYDMNRISPLVPDEREQSPGKWDSGFVAAAFTIMVRHRVKLFANENAVREFEGILLAELSASSSEALVYLFMPDHCHVLLRGQDDEVSLLTAMKGFRHKGGFWFPRVHCDARWRGRPDDQNCTGQREIANHALFVLNDPVRCGLVDDWRHYRYRGSSLSDLELWLDQHTSTPDLINPPSQVCTSRMTSLEDEATRVQRVALP